MYDSHNENAQPEAAAQEAPAAAPQGDGLPGPIDTPEVQKVVADVKTDGADLAAGAKAAVKQQIDDAVAAAGKLLSAAAGDAVALLSDGEAAAISVVVHNTPPQFQPVVSGFAAAFAGKVEATANEVASTAVQHGLAWALNWLQVAQAAAEKAL